MAVGEDHGGGGGMVTRCGHCDGGDENGLDGRRGPWQLLPRQLGEVVAAQLVELKNCHCALIIIGEVCQNPCTAMQGRHAIKPNPSSAVASY